MLSHARELWVTVSPLRGGGRGAVGGVEGVPEYVQQGGQGGATLGLVPRGEAGTGVRASLSNNQQRLWTPSGGQEDGRQPATSCQSASFVVAPNLKVRNASFSPTSSVVVIEAVGAKLWTASCRQSMRLGCGAVAGETKSAKGGSDWRGTV